MRGFFPVFRFTLARQCASRGWRGFTVGLSLLLFLLPAVLLPLIGYTQLDGPSPEPAPEPPPELTEPVGPVTAPDAAALDLLLIFDEVSGPALDAELFRQAPEIGAAEIRFCTDFDEISRLSAQLSPSFPRLCALLLSENEGVLTFTVLPVEGSLYPENAADSLAFSLQDLAPQLLAAKSGASVETVLALHAPIFVTLDSEQSFSDADPLGSFREILGMLLPYLNIMLIYFLVLFYGQTVANTVILEKTSKLMDTFLVSVPPRSLLLGKVLAIWLASTVQFMAWVVSFLAGLGLGVQLLKWVDPSSLTVLRQSLTLLQSLSELFSLPGLFLSLILILSGFFLYCSIAAIGGALAGKPEDLSNTNILFTLVLIVSFFVTLQSGFLSGEVRTTLSWMDLVPFTAILITPSRLLLGNVPLWAGLAAFSLTAALSVLLVLLSARIYQLLALYKGKVPSPRQLLTMLRAQRH